MDADARVAMFQALSIFWNESLHFTDTDCKPTFQFSQDHLFKSNSGVGYNFEIFTVALLGWVNNLISDNKRNFSNVGPVSDHVIK